MRRGDRPDYFSNTGKAIKSQERLQVEYRGYPKRNIGTLGPFFALLHGFPQILIAFAAMKLGTRLHHEKESDISNTYFLVGNLMSILIALLAVVITKAWWGN
jgi:hypothetical protein